MIFKPYNAHAATARTRRHLPHWQQDGVCYFVTFRLGDSLPQSLLDQWQEEREIWLRWHPEPWSAEVEAEYHERFTAKREQWLDAGHGQCHLRQPEVREKVAASLHKFDGERYDLDSFVIMPNHVHLIWQLRPDRDLGRELKGLKGGSAWACNEALARTGTFWMEESYDRIVRDAEELAALRRYIENNPAKAGLKPHEYTLETRSVLQVVP